MLVKITENIYGMIWTDYRENNCNTYLVTGRPNIIIDPGHRHLGGHVRQSLAELGLGPADVGVVLVTHAHPDHFEAARSFGPETLVGMGAVEYSLLGHIEYMAVPEPDFLLQAGTLTLGDATFTVLEAPGHSPASICFYEEKTGRYFPGMWFLKTASAGATCRRERRRAEKKHHHALRAGRLLSVERTRQYRCRKEAVAANFKFG